MAITHVGGNSPATVPSGYMGAEARGYSGGVLKGSSGFIYNNSAAIAMSNSKTYTQTAAANYNSTGYTAHWNKSYYQTFSTYLTPSISN